MNAMNADPMDTGSVFDEDDQLIETWLDGGMSEDDYRLLVERAAHDPALGDRMHAARMVRSLFESLTAESFPADRLDHVLSTARREARRDFANRVLAAGRSLITLDWKPVLAMASLLAVTLTATLVSRPGSRRPVDPEVAMALEQVKWTLGFVADVGRRTGESVRSQVIEPHLVQPMQKAVAHVLDVPKPIN